MWPRVWAVDRTPSSPHALGKSSSHNRRPTDGDLSRSCDICFPSCPPSRYRGQRRQAITRHRETREVPMSEDHTIPSGTNAPSGMNAWGSPPPPEPVRHNYSLAVRDYGLTTALSLLVRSFPYALARFAILLGGAVACIIWIVIAFGGAAWLANHIAGAFGFVWLLICCV